jgi:hypothetical protein
MIALESITADLCVHHVIVGRLCVAILGKNSGEQVDWAGCFRPDWGLSQVAVEVAISKRLTTGRPTLPGGRAAWESVTEAVAHDASGFRQLHDVLHF